MNTIKKFCRSCPGLVTIKNKSVYFELRTKEEIDLFADYILRENFKLNLSEQRKHSLIIHESYRIINFEKINNISEHFKFKVTKSDDFLSDTMDWFVDCCLNLIDEFQEKNRDKEKMKVTGLTPEKNYHILIQSIEDSRKRQDEIIAKLYLKYLGAFYIKPKNLLLELLKEENEIIQEKGANFLIKNEELKKELFVKHFGFDPGQLDFSTKENRAASRSKLNDFAKIIKRNEQD